MIAKTPATSGSIARGFTTTSLSVRPTTNRTTPNTSTRITRCDKVRNGHCDASQASENDAPRWLRPEPMKVQTDHGHFIDSSFSGFGCLDSRSGIDYSCNQDVTIGHAIVSTGSWSSESRADLGGISSTYGAVAALTIPGPSGTTAAGAALLAVGAIALLAGHTWGLMVAVPAHITSSGGSGRRWCSTRRRRAIVLVTALPALALTAIIPAADRAPSPRRSPAAHPRVVRRRRVAPPCPVAGHPRGRPIRRPPW